MKTAISLPDLLFERAERMAKRLGKSRSQLYAGALMEYVARYDPDDITAAMNRVCDAVDTRPDAFVAEAARRQLEGIEWS